MNKEEMEKIIDTIKEHIDNFFFIKLDYQEVKNAIHDYNEIDREMMKTLKNRNENEFDAYIFGKLIAYHQILFLLEKKKLELLRFLSYVDFDNTNGDENE
jgi:hypothetical protein